MLAVPASNGQIRFRATGDEFSPPRLKLKKSPPQIPLTKTTILKESISIYAYTYMALLQLLPITKSCHPVKNRQRSLRSLRLKIKKSPPQSPLTKKRFSKQSISIYAYTYIALLQLLPTI